MHDGRSRGVFLEFSKDNSFATAYWKGIKVELLRRYVALYRTEPFWVVPFFGNNQHQIPERCLVICLERTDDLKIILVPLIDKGYNCYIKGKAEGIELIADNNCKTGKITRLVGLYVGIDKDPYILIENAAKAIKNFIKTGTLRKEKGLPEWANYLGYCTWNTFYHKINQENVFRMVNNIVKRNKVKIGFILLDDGWQKITIGRKLRDKGVDEKKFPEGLQKFVSFVKKNFGIKYFLIWHTFQGYWHSLSLRGQYGKKFKLTRTLFYWGPSNTETIPFPFRFLTYLWRLFKITRNYFGILLPDKMAEFWNDFHGWLASQGVDGVKVDNQSGTELQCFNLGYQANLMKKYHETVENSVTKHFSKYSIINCMSQNSNILYQTIESNITRNSQDYMPKKEIEQTQHVLINVYNNLWCGQFVHPDWDMFQSDHPWGYYQAAARAISGSIIYFADLVNKINVDVLSKIALSNGKILKCSDIALPCRKTIFMNPAKPKRAIMMFNHNNCNSVLGVFNAMLKTETTVRYSPSDVEGLSLNEEYVLYGFNSRSLKRMKYDDYAEIALKPREFEIFTVGQLKNGFAPIGLIDKYNPGGIFEEIIYNKEKISLKVKFGGIFGFYSENEPKKALVNREEILFDFNQSNKLLKISTEEYEGQLIEILF